MGEPGEAVLEQGFPRCFAEVHHSAGSDVCLSVLVGLDSCLQNSCFPLSNQKGKQKTVKGIKSSIVSPRKTTLNTVCGNWCHLKKVLRVD